MNEYNRVECACGYHHNIQFMRMFHNILEIHIETLNCIATGIGEEQKCGSEGKANNSNGLVWFDSFCIFGKFEIL